MKERCVSVTALFLLKKIKGCHFERTVGGIKLWGEEKSFASDKS